MIESIMVIIILERILTFKQIDRVAFLAAFALGVLTLFALPYSHIYPTILMLIWAVLFLARAIRNMMGDK